MWWLGFDMAHAGDLVGLSCIRTDDECVQETNFFADQLSVIGGEVK